MSARQLFLEVLDFKPNVRTLNWEFGYWGGALNRWYNEGLERKHGLPKKVSYGQPVSGPGHHWPMPSVADEVFIDRDVAECFQFNEPLHLLPFNQWLYPRFEETILHEETDRIELLDTDGIRKVIKKDGSSMPLFLSWPVWDEKSWEKLKEERLNLDNIKDRYIEDPTEIMKRACSRTFPLGLFGDPVGFFGSLRFLFGEVNLFMFYYDKPELLKKIAAYLCDFWIQIAEELLTVTDFDAVFFWEDMAGKQGSLISPKLFKEFMTPHYKRLIGFLKSRGLKHFIVDSDGNVSELIPLFIEAGLTGMYPFEIQAGNDILKIRQKYPKLQIIGGINKNALAGDKKSIDTELATVEKMLKFGGYVPYADHLVPPDVSWENYRYYRQRLKDIIYNHSQIDRVSVQRSPITTYYPGCLPSAKSETVLSRKLR
jgi:hypothetical protein